MTTSRTILLAVALLAQNIQLPAAASGPLRVIISGGFANAYHAVLPEFERTTSLMVTTTSGASQGNGPDTIGAQLRRGVSADLVIMSREGLEALVAGGRIASGRIVDLARTPTGIAVRAGAPKPDISSVDALTQTLLRAGTVALPGSTTGIYLTTMLFPRLGIAGRITTKVTARGADAVALVAAGDAALAIQPASELLHAPGVDYVGPIPREVQFISVFSAGVVAGADGAAAATRLIAYLTSTAASPAIVAAGMEPVPADVSKR
jgi:molybdate transport system substrate-binding protein